MIKENRDDFCLLTYYRPGRSRRREIFSADFRLTYKCNQNCVFCAADQRKLDEPQPDVVRKTLLRTLKKGIQRICFEGGEPTLLPELPEFLHLSKQAGVRDIVLMTNGMRAADHGYAKTLSDAGANRVFISLHAHTSALSETITATPGSFERTVSGIHGFLATRAHTSLIFVMTSLNMESLPGYLKFVRREFGRIPVLLSMATPYLEPTLYTSLIPKYRDMEPVLKQSARLAAEIGIPLSAMEE
ncbi:MAG TPA: radical SAM protein, partial [bacterium]|nr:radical SAM protein [bacterium]